MILRSMVEVGLLGVLPFLGACKTMSVDERAKWDELRGLGVRDPEPYKSSWVAGGLNLLVPGVGTMYLGEWGWGFGLFASNLLWPLSIAWAVPEALLDAETINKTETIYYYFHTPGGQQRLAGLRSGRLGAAVPASGSRE